MPDYEFYRGVFGGTSLSETEFAACLPEAAAQLRRFGRIYQLTPLEETAEETALCRMAEVIAYFDWVENGGLAGGLSVGSVAQTGSPVERPTPAARSGALYRAAQLSFAIDRGCGG